MDPHGLPARMLDADWMLADPGDGGTIDAQMTGVLCLKTETAETRTLPDPMTAGQRLSIVMDVDGGDCVVTAASAINQTGNTIMTFENAGDFIELVGVYVGGALVWRAIAALPEGDAPALS